MDLRLNQPVHFISGLPRSGSTLLAAILRQNPLINAGMTSPLYSMWTAVLPKMGGGSEFSSFFDDGRRKDVLSGIFEGYYAQDIARPYRIDTNRYWTSRLDIIHNVYPTAKVICCVRDIGEIINSVESALRINPMQTSRVFNHKATSTVYGRAETLMNSESGLIGLAWSSLRDGWFGEHSSKLIVIEYKALVSRPAAAIDFVYDQLSLPWFRHDFDNVSYEAESYDADLGMPGMHKVKSKVQPQKRQVVVPPDLFAKYADTSFWRRPDLRRGIAAFE